MRADTIARAVAFALIVAGTSILAAPAQTTAQPGQMTQAHVWVQNRGRSEAIPVDVRELNLDAPLRVQVINGEQQYASINPVQVREVRRVWDYETILIPADAPDSMAALLNARGANGWETTGIATVNANGTTLLLKRPR
jgi:Spy/CpxP family protein refolding chaperone